MSTVSSKLSHFSLSTGPNSISESHSILKHQFVNCTISTEEVMDVGTVDVSNEVSSYKPCFALSEADSDAALALQSSGCFIYANCTISTGEEVDVGTIGVEIEACCCFGFVKR